MNAEVTRRGVFDMQVCIPAQWTDEEIVGFANAANPCGTSNGWTIRTDERLLKGDPVRQPCERRKNFVHVMLDA